MSETHDPALPAGLGLEHALLPLAWQIARRAGDLLLGGRHEDLSVDTKTTRTDVVTHMDRASEALIVEAILAARPTDGILGEEGSDRAGTSGVRWIIDPLDGTVNYLYGLPGWAVSIAVQHDDVTVVGIVDVPVLGETFVGVLGQGARWVRSDGVVTPRPNTPDRLAECLVATGFGYAAERRSSQARTLAEVLPRVRDIRRAGAAAVDLCWAASGVVDCYFERGLQPWDLRAGELIAREAGLVVGGPPGEAASGELTWAAPAHLAEEFAALIHGAGAHHD